MESNFCLKGKQILITGAGSGIGKAISLSAYKLGASLVLVDINKNLLDSILSEIGSNNIQIIEADLTDLDQIKEISETCENIDGLVNNVGISNTKPISHLTEIEFYKVMDLNLKAPVFLTSYLYKRKKINKKGSIVFTSSLAGLRTFTPGNSLYSMSKSALTSFTKSCSVEFASRQIRSNCICPAMVNTPLRDKLGFDEETYNKDIQKYLLKRYAEPNEIADVVTFLLSDASSFITGQTLIVDGGRSII